jgi:NDP-sugar pyrophosphorylase family protein
MTNIVIPMAGLGHRFKKNGILVPKPLILVNNKTLIEHSVESLGIDGKYIFITRKYFDEEYNKSLSRILKKIKPDSIEICLDHDQYGAADAALYAKDYIDNNEELIITNCDQILIWDSKKFLELSRSENCDGAVAIFKSSDEKNSFATIIDDKVINIVEKNAISDNALTGVHYWRKGSSFVLSAKKLLSEYRLKGFNECYISLTYNYLIEDKLNILAFNMPQNGYISLGTPEDVDIYLSKIKEYYTDKPKTIFCDIDGTLIKHVHRFSYVGFAPAIALNGVINKFNEWDSKGHKIILTTARKESARILTEKQLTDLGLCWDQLIMGVTSGARVLINDKHLDIDDDRAVALNVITDQGFDGIEWNKIGL